MPNVTKKDLIDQIVGATKEKRVVVKSVVQAFLDLIVEHLGRGERIELRDFGVFEVKLRARRVAQNPKTLAKVDVPAKRSVKFKAGRLMKERVDRADSDGGSGSGSSDGGSNGHVSRPDRPEGPIVETPAARRPARI